MSIVTFTIVGKDGTLIPENELQYSLEKLKPLILPLDEREGMVSLYDETGSYNSYNLTSFNDDIMPLIGDLCDTAVEELAAGKDYKLEMFNHDEQVLFKIEGDNIVISSSAIEEDIRYPKDLLLEELSDCNERFMKIYYQLNGTP